MVKVGDISATSTIYECNKCGNLTACLKGEKLPRCSICEENNRKQQWKKTNQHLLIRTKDVTKEFEKNRSVSDMIADFITAFCGSMFFVYIHIIWFALWLIYNIVAQNPFDPFPFGLLTLIVSLEAIVLATFILISQNRQGAISELRSELDYQIDLKSEKNIAELLAIQREMYETLKKK
ncbi:DUF1003 domain-containing protein [Candidatus Woesearchaeota archaeon]|nr:DUF1003 domain-containing protein [Candidatus Woesearchaeota archaeon]